MPPDTASAQRARLWKASCQQHYAVALRLPTPVTRGSRYSSPQPYNAHALARGRDVKFRPLQDTWAVAGQLLGCIPSEM